MKKIVIVLFLLSYHFAFAGTGGANDSILLYLVIIASLSIILGVLYSISFFKRIIKEHKEKRIAHFTDKVDGENVGNEFS